MVQNFQPEYLFTLKKNKYKLIFQGISMVYLLTLLLNDLSELKTFITKLVAAKLNIYYKNIYIKAK